MNKDVQFSNLDSRNSIDEHSNNARERFSHQATGGGAVNDNLGSDPYHMREWNADPANQQWLRDINEIVDMAKRSKGTTHHKPPKDYCQFYLPTVGCMDKKW